MDSLTDPLKEIYVDYARAGLPGNIHVDLTYECPLDCIHCYAKGSETLHPELMDTAMVMDLLDQAAELGTIEVGFSGGEPLLRKDIWELIEYARRLHFVVKLKTSGIYLTQGHIDFMAGLGLVWVDISLHGISPQVHDAITRVPGSFQKAMSAIRALHRAGIRVQVNSSVLQSNFHDIPKLRQFLDDLGIGNGLSMSIMPSETKGMGPQKNAMAGDAFIQTSLAMFKKDGIKPPKTDGYDLSEPLCYAGRSSMHVGPDGLVRPCVTWPVVAGDLKTQSLRDIWFDSPVFKRIRKLFMKDRQQCRSCNLFGYCNFCPGRAFQATGDPIMPYTDACTAAQWTREAYERFTGLAPDTPGQGPKDR